MTDRTNEIQQLQAKRDKAQTLLTQAQTRKESLEERRAENVAKMAKLGVTPENAEEKLAKLTKKLDLLLEDAQEKLAGIDL